MTATINCPNCGAPLSIEPQPGETTFECSFCHDTVLLPEEIRVPLPPVVIVDQPSPPPRSTNRTSLVVVGIVATCVLAFIVFAIISEVGSNSRSSALDTISDTGAPVATADTGATREAKATVDALQPLLKQEQAWPESFSEKFLDNSHAWETGDVRDSYLTGSRTISDGTYTWKITAVKSVFDSSFPTMPDQTDFYASVDLTPVNMPDDIDADTGIVFRYNSTDQSWYYFSINDKGADWSTLIHQTKSAAILPGKKNRVAVGAQGSQFIFLINDQMVDYFNNDYLKSGGIGVGLSLTEAGEKGTVEFANFTVQSPP